MELWIALAAAALVAVAAVVLLVARRRGHRAAPSPAAQEGAAGRPGTAELLWRGLSATRRRLVAQLDGVLGRGGSALGLPIVELEEVLIGADVGVATTAALLGPL